jgi:uncharacterized transporter YbjL
MTIVLLITFLARSALGLSSALVLSFLVWRAFEVTVNTRDLSLGLEFFLQALIVGLAAAVPTAFSWWNTHSARKTQFVFAVYILIAAVTTAWVVNEIRGVETHYALFAGVTRLQVLSRTHMFVGMMSGAVLGGNAMAAGLYLYRAVKHREH